MRENLEKCSSKWIESLSLDEKFVRQIEQVSSKMRSFSSWTSLHLLLVSVRQNCSESQNVGAGLFEQLLLEVLCLFSDFWCWNLWPHLLQENTCLTCSPACILSSSLGTVADTGNLREEVQMSRSGRFELGSGRMSGKRERLQESGKTELPSISTAPWQSILTLLLWAVENDWEAPHGSGTLLLRVLLTGGGRRKGETPQVVARWGISIDTACFWPQRGYWT